MTDGVQFSILGLDELLGKLDSVNQDLKYKGGRFALRKAANLVRDAAKQNAQRLDDPNSDADISKNIAVRWSGRTFKATGDLKFRVGVMGGAGGRAKKGSQKDLPGGDTRHWRHLEFGTEKTRAQPFMRPALEDNIGQATGAFVDNYWPAVERALRRARKKKA